MPPASATLRAFLLDQYDSIFGRPWPVLGSALVLGSLNVFLFAFDRPWTASDGIRNWGDWLLRTGGALDQPDLLPPLLYSGSLLNLGLLLGGFVAALLSREFAVRGAPARELAKGAAGGILMGLGAVLSFGCNIGGFFSALSALSLSGVAMMAGLALGAFLGARFLLLETRNPQANGASAFQSPCEAPPQAPCASLGIQPVFGLLTLVVLGAGIYLYGRLGFAPQAVFLLFGLAFGVILQRSRFCLVRAFREPFMTGESEHTRAAALAIVLTAIGFSILKATDLKDAGDWVFPAFWFGALFGGLLFGLGMVLAGGCGAGSIWRAGEGHVKLWVALFFFALAASAMRLILARAELLGRLGDAVFLPNLFGWGGAILAVAALMTAWYALAGWHERSRSWSS